MIYSYNATEQVLDTNEALVYNVDAVKTGTTVTHTSGTSVFTFNKSGYYYVTVTAIATAATAQTEPTTIALFNGDVAIAGATASSLISVDNGVVNLVINVILPVRPSCCAIDNTVNLSVVNTGVASTYTNTTISITKLA